MRKTGFVFVKTVFAFSALFISSLSIGFAQPAATVDAPPPAETAIAKQPATVIPVPRDAQWMKRHDAINDRLKKGNVDMLLVGDSITRRWEDAGKDVWNKFYEKRNAVNLGFGGDQTQHVLWRLENSNLDGISPKLAMLMIGTNNSNAKALPEDTAAGVKAIVDKLREELPQTKILVLGIFPRGADDNDILRQRNMKVNEIIAKLADDKNVFYLDIGDKFLGPDRKLSKEIMPDRLHLSTKGYTIWAEEVDPTVAKLMGEK